MAALLLTVLALHWIIEEHIGTLVTLVETPEPLTLPLSLTDLEQLEL